MKINETFEFANAADFKDQFWGRNFLITVSEHGAQFLVNADCLQDAFDYVIDFCADEENGFSGLLWTVEEEAEQDFLSEYICGGNEGRYLSTYNTDTHEF